MTAQKEARHRAKNTVIRRENVSVHLWLKDMKRGERFSHNGWIFEKYDEEWLKVYNEKTNEELGTTRLYEFCYWYPHLTWNDIQIIKE